MMVLIKAKFAGLLNNASPEEAHYRARRKKTSFASPVLNRFYCLHESGVGCQKTLYFSLPNIRRTIAAAKAAGWRRKGRILKCWSGHWPGHYKLDTRGVDAKTIMLCNTWPSRFSSRLAQGETKAR